MQGGAQPDSDIAALGKHHRQAAGNRYGDGETAEIAHAFDRPIEKPAQQAVGQGHGRKPHQRDETDDRERPSRRKRQALERRQHYFLPCSFASSASSAWYTSAWRGLFAAQLLITGSNAVCAAFWSAASGNTTLRFGSLSSLLMSELSYSSIESM